ncbi:hypothetical protein EBZ80_00325 [bacterium]|nr:hypothetical protein [bacterium]
MAGIIGKLGKTWRVVLVTAVVMGSPAVSSCATVKGWFDGDGKKDDTTDEVKPVASASVPQAPRAKPAVDPDEVADLQLKMTRLMARTEELEEKFSRQQERLQIIERGLTLGIVPDELQPAGKGKSPAAVPAAKKTSRVEADEENEKTAAVAKPEPKAAVGDPVREEGIPAAIREEFNKDFAAAHEDFRAGRFGKAIVAFSEIGKKYDPALTSGVHQFWIARSWAGLKELQTARQLFNEFVVSFPASPWAPRAKLELARVESALGLKETAIKRLRGVISEYPLEDVAEMAKSEVERMSRTL